MNEAMLAELKHEASTTRKVLQRVPANQFDWQPHLKSMALKRLASHLADIYQWPLFIVGETDFDFAKGGFKTGNPDNEEGLLQIFDENLRRTIDLLSITEPVTLDQPWTLRRGDHIIFSLPRKVVIRSMMMNHIVHHRGQLTVYLRLLNISVPSIYGPSADEAF